MNHINLLKEYAEAFANVSPDVLQNASTALAASQLFSVFYGVDTRALKQRLQSHPELYISLIHALCALRQLDFTEQKLELKRQQFQAQQRARDQKLRVRAARKPILITPATIEMLTTTIGRASVLASHEPPESKLVNPVTTDASPSFISPTISGI
jgi:hypothetical protein